ncbi:MAG: hypothetical protein HYX48_08350 [Chlamydiales bacterium]|nr:hypothetical protein [Chlamydiales bacterium]
MIGVGGVTGAGQQPYGFGAGAGAGVQDGKAAEGKDDLKNYVSVSDTNDLRLEDGGRYKGETEIVGAARLPHGKGFLIYANGDQCDGAFIYGRKEGFCKYTWVMTGDVYEGQFFNDKQTEGTLTFEAGKKRFVGTFKNGDPDVGELYPDFKNKPTHKVKYEKKPPEGAGCILC